MNLLLDTNILLDVLLDRAPWVADSAGVWAACDQGRASGFVAAVSLPNIFYVVRKHVTLARAHDCVAMCLDAFTLIPITRDTFDRALRLPRSDLEDNLQIASAQSAGLDAIVTRDPKGLFNASVPILSPAGLLAIL